MPLAIDASVANKWVIDERDTQQALALCDRDLVAPDLLVSECCNILWKVAQRGEIKPALAFQKTDNLLSEPVTLVASSGLARRALEITLELGHPAYDACYLAAAEMHGTRLVRADTRLLRRLATTPLAHLAISVQDAAAN